MNQQSFKAGLLTAILSAGGIEADDASELWTGTVVAEGTVYESGGHHPCKTTMKVRLREAGRSGVDGGVRVDLRSEGSTYEVEMAVHGLIECTGKATDTVTDPVAQSAIFYPSKAPARYHLILSRAFFAFTCGGRRVLSSSRRAAGIGTEPPIPFDPSDLETSDPEARFLEGGDTRMTGSFTTSRQVTVGRQSPQNIYRYDYKVRWEICRGAFYCSS